MAFTSYEAMPLDQMLNRVQKYHPGDGYKLVEKAWKFAEKAHEGQFRKSGEPYFTHPSLVASILTDLMIDPPTIAAGLLHDTVEDCEGITLDTIREEFGDEVADLVDGVTKLNKLDFADREEAQAESLRKMILAMSRDIRVVLIKLADRLHNMRTLRFQPEARRQAIARETLDIYAPLAHRLGVYALKQDLEDLSLKYLDPEGYNNIVHLVGMKRAEREESIRLVIDELSARLDEQHIHFDIDGRSKHFYSIYRKMVLQHKTFDQIYDLIAIRVIVDTIPDCYAVLGIVHTLWNQVPGRFKDYISVPKANMYQSLHTTVVGWRKIPFPFEVQIRTWEMHRTAEYGIAAHWRYKEGKQVDSLDSKLYWLRQILDWQNETHDPSEFMDALKVDLFSDEVFVFTPKGDIVNLPRGATPVDFAYHIHSAIGNKCIGAKVNGRIVPLETALETGDFVEVLTSGSSKGPSMDWLKICKTSEAKSKIRAYFKHAERDENLARGKELMEHEAKRQGIALSQLTKPEFMEAVVRRYTLHSVEDVYVTVGFGGLSAGQVVNRLMEEYRKAVAKQAETNPAPAPEAAKTPDRKSVISQHHSNGVIVQGDADMLVRFARCCNPLPGDDIVGYITRGRGVSIHRRDCTNMSDMMQDPDRFIEVAWEGTEKQSAAPTAYEASIRLIAYDRLGLFADISTMLSKMEISIASISARIDKSKARHTTCIDMTLSITDTKQLELVMEKLRKRGDILEVFRTTA